MQKNIVVSVEQRSNEVFQVVCFFEDHSSFSITLILELKANLRHKARCSNFVENFFYSSLPQNCKDTVEKVIKCSVDTNIY